MNIFANPAMAGTKFVVEKNIIILVNPGLLQLYRLSTISEPTLIFDLMLNEITEYAKYLNLCESERRSLQPSKTAYEVNRREVTCKITETISYVITKKETVLYEILDNWTWICFIRALNKAISYMTYEEPTYHVILRSFSDSLAKLKMEEADKSLELYSDGKDDKFMQETCSALDGNTTYLKNFLLANYDIILFQYQMTKIESFKYVESE